MYGQPPMPNPQGGPYLIFARHRRFLEKAAVFVANDMCEPKTASYRELLLLLTRRLIAHKAWLSNIEEHHRGLKSRRQSRSSDLTPPVWDPIVVTHRSCVAEDGGGTVLQVEGPSGGDTHTILVENEQVAATAIKALARATHQAVLACNLPPTRSISTQPLYPANGPISDTAAANASHIALLKEYNDLRDVAQQLIGIIADNWGVPVRSLYTDRSFGIGVDD